MGKVRIKHMGIEEIEREEREKRRRQREQKRIREEGKKKKKKDTRAPGLKGGERVVSMTSEEEIDELVKIAREAEKRKEKLAKQAADKKAAEKKAKGKRQKKGRSQRYKKTMLKVDKNKEYPIEDAVKLIKQVSYSRFNGTIEAHINTRKLGIRGTINLPHGTGKKRRVAIADDDVLKKVEKGIIDFDILIATPSQMKEVAKLARILGPKGLMPNPKSGTITDKPEELKKELEGGKISFKTEPKQPIIHQAIGKVDFSEDKIIENFNALISAIGIGNIKSAFIAATMSPSIKIKLN